MNDAWADDNHQLNLPHNQEANTYNPQHEENNSGVIENFDMKKKEQNPNHCLIYMRTKMLNPKHFSSIDEWQESVPTEEDNKNNFVLNGK